jgi:hypothetical protein
MSIRTIPERAVRGFAETLIADRLPYLTELQQSETAQFVVARWNGAAQFARIGVGTVASSILLFNWMASRSGVVSEDRARQLFISKLARRDAPLISELTTFVLSVATVYACDRWPDVVGRGTAGTTK